MGTQYNKPAVLPAWGESNTTSADMIQPSDGAIQTGWPLSTTPPARQIWNWLCNYVDNGLRYLMQRGISDYDAAETYRVGSVCIGDDNLTYKSLVANNIGHTPSTSPTQWIRWGFTAAQLASSLAKPIVVVYSSTPTIDLSLGSVFEITLTGNATPNFTNPQPGQSIRLFIKEDGSGAHTWTWPSGWPGGDINTSASAVNIQDFCLDNESNVYSRGLITP